MDKGIPKVNLVLFFVTLSTTFGAGYLQSLPLVNKGLLKDPWLSTIAFSLGIMAILGCHELGHKIMADRKRVEASFPYFIPGPPSGIGTFGAVISMKTQPKDRNSLFDIGATGPIAGFFIIIPVTILGLLWSFPVSAEQIKDLSTTSLPLPLLFSLLLNWLVPFIPLSEEKNILLFHPLAFAGWVGMVVTMLNLMPIGTLDGGHISRALLGKKIFSISSFKISFHTMISLLVALLMAQMGYWLMALLILSFGMWLHPGPVDDTVPVSKGRKILAVGLFLLLAICAVPI